MDEVKLILGNATYALTFEKEGVQVKKDKEMSIDSIYDEILKDKISRNPQRNSKKR